MPGAHYLLAAVLLTTGDNATHSDDAETELKKELAVSPRDSATYAALGKIAVTRHNYPDAETYLKKAISLGPPSPDPYLYLGQMYFDTNRPAEAEAAQGLMKVRSANRHGAHYAAERAPPLRRRRSHSGWQPGHQYAVRFASPWPRERIGSAQRGHGRPARR